MSFKNELVVIGIDPGVTTGWAKITIPMDSIFGDEPGEIIDWKYGMLDGPETGQAQTFCRIAKRYIFPAIAIEDFDNRRPLRNREYLAPVRVASKIEFCIQTGMAGQVTGHEWQMPSLAFETAPDDRLKRWGLYPPGPEHPKDATRHARTLIRRAKKDPKLARRIFHTFGQA
jgi:hypothetical protein